MTTDTTLQDQSPSMLNPRVVAEVIMAVAAVVLVLLWHMTIVLTSSGVGLGDVKLTLHSLLRGHPLQVGTGHHPSAILALIVFVGLMVGLMVVVGVLCYLWVMYGPRRSTGSKGLATAADLDRVGEARARELAKQTRPSMTPAQIKKADLTEFGWKLGVDLATGKPIIATPEDNVLVKGPPGSRKTSALLIPAALDARGPLVVTSTKPDLLDVIYEARGRMGRVWVFDPLGLASWPEPMVWNPVDGCQSTRLAERRGPAFADGLGSGDGVKNNAFFTDMASSLLTYCLHAAALNGEDMRTVLEWGLSITETQAHEAQELIRSSTDPRSQRLYADMLNSTVVGAGETVSSTRMQFTRMVRALADEEVMAMVVPHEGVAEFDATAFVTSTDTLVLLSDDQSAVKAGALTAMLFNEVIAEAKRLANISMLGRLDPPLRIVGDEIPNIAPLKVLPSFASTCRGNGIEMVLGVQDDAQVYEKWGQFGGNTLMISCSYEAFLPGIKNKDTLERASALAGKVDVVHMTGSYGEDGYLVGQTSQSQLREVLPIDKIKNLDDGTALVLARNSPAAVIRLQPWFERRDAAELRAAAQRTRALRAHHAAELEEAAFHG